MSNIKEVLMNKNLDAILISDEYNIRYLSGVEYEGYYLATKDNGYILTDSRYTVVCEKLTKRAEVITLSKGEDYISLISRMCKELNIKILGFEDLHLTYSKYIKFNSGLGVDLVPIGNEIEKLRVIKTEEELKNLEMAESIGDKAFDYVLGIIKPGMTEMELAIEIENSMKRNGAEKLSFDTIVASGINGSMPHAVPSQKKLKKNEFITMDFGCKYNGYCSDMTRTIFLGKANDKQKEVYNTVLEAQLKSLEFIKAGVKGKEVDKVARDVITAAGYGEYFGHGLGHSVGLFIHESPSLSPKDETYLQENMIETVEPGIYIPDFGGVRIEDMVVVTKSGHINFAKSPKNLIEIN